MRNALRLLLGIAVSLASLYFATRGTDWAGVGDVLRSVSPLWVVGILVASVFSVYIRVLRWRVLLRPLGDIPVYPAFSATAIGFGASAVLPFRVGEFIRPALLGRHTGVRMSAALSSVVLERLFDMLLVIACFLLLSLTYPIPSGLKEGAWLLGAIAGVGFAVLVAMERRRAQAETLLEWLLGWLPGRLRRALRPLVFSFLDGLGGLRDLRTIAVVLGYSAYLWGVIALTFLFAFPALRISVPLLPASLATVVSVAAAVFLPQAPGFVGTWQAGCVLALGLFDVPQEVAVGYSLLTWIAQMVVNIGTAGVFLAREDFSLGQILHLSQEAPASAEVK